jgi:hypothetical protein
MEQEMSRKQIEAATNRIRGIRHDTEIGAKLIEAFQLPPRDIATQMSANPTFLTNYEQRWDTLLQIGIHVQTVGASDYIIDVGTFLTGTQVYSRLASVDAQTVLNETHATRKINDQTISPDATMKLEPLPVADGTTLAEHPLFQRVLMLMGAAMGKRTPTRDYTGETVRLQFPSGGGDGGDYQISASAKVGQNFEIFGGDSAQTRIFTVVPKDYADAMKDDEWEQGEIVPGSSGDDVPDTLKNMSVDDTRVVVMGKTVADKAAAADQWLHACYWNMDSETRTRLRQLMKVATRTANNPQVGMCCVVS